MGAWPSRAQADCAAGRRRHGGVRSGALVRRWEQALGLSLRHHGQLWEAGGGGTGPTASWPRLRRRLVVSFCSPPFGPSHSGSVKRGHNHVPGEGAVQDEPLHIFPDPVSPSSSLLTKRDTLVESIPAEGWCRFERKSPGQPRVVFPRLLC